MIVYAQYNRYVTDRIQYVKTSNIPTKAKTGTFETYANQTSGNLEAVDENGVVSILAGPGGMIPANVAYINAANLFSQPQTITINNLADFPTEGLTLRNTTPATALVPMQDPPVLKFSGYGWTAGVSKITTGGFFLAPTVTGELGGIIVAVSEDGIDYNFAAKFSSDGAVIANTGFRTNLSQNLNDVLKYNGTNFVPGTLTTSDIAGLTTTNVPEGTNLYFLDSRAQNSLTFNAPLNRIAGNVSITAASNVQDGYLTSTDWNTFNNSIHTINAVAASSQLLVATHDGSDFTIVSALGPGFNEHHFNIPYSSPVSNGLLESINFNIFANKENVLTFNAPLTRAINDISLDTTNIALLNAANNFINENIFGTANDSLGQLEIGTGLFGAAEISFPAFFGTTAYGGMTATTLGTYINSNLSGSVNLTLDNQPSLSAFIDRVETYVPFSTPLGDATRLGINRSGTAFGTVQKLMINPYTTVDNASEVIVTSSSGTNKALTIQAFDSTINPSLFQIQNRLAAPLFSFGANPNKDENFGAMRVAGGYFAIQNETGSEYLELIRSVSDEWTDNVSATGLFVPSSSSGNIVIAAARDSYANRIQLSSLKTQITDYPPYATAPPSSALLELLQTPNSGGGYSRSIFKVIGGDLTGQSNNTELNDLYFNLAHSIKWENVVGQVVANERTILIKAPTYGVDAGGDVSITNLATFTVDAAPSVSAGVTATNKYSIWAQAGLAAFDGGARSTIFNATTGYQVGGVAASGNYLRGNGTNFVSSAIQAGDIPSLSATYASLSANNTFTGTNTFNALTVTSSFASGYISTTSASYTVTATDNFIAVDATAGNKVVNLPAASAVTGRELTVKKTDGSVNTVTVTRAGADTIDGATTDVIAVQYTTRSYEADGVSSWWVK